MRVFTPNFSMQSFLQTKLSSLQKWFPQNIAKNSNVRNTHTKSPFAESTDPFYMLNMGTHELVPLQLSSMNASSPCVWGCGRGQTCADHTRSWIVCIPWRILTHTELTEREVQRKLFKLLGLDWGTIPLGVRASSRFSFPPNSHTSTCQAVSNPGRKT